MTVISTVEYSFDWSIPQKQPPPIIFEKKGVCLVVWDECPLLLLGRGELLAIVEISSLTSCPAQKCCWYSDLKFQMHFYADCSALSRNCLEALLACYSALAQLLYNDWDLSKVLIILRYDAALLCYKLQMMNNWRVQLPSTSWKIVSSPPSLMVFLG